MQISVASDWHRLSLTLNDLQRKQLPFAFASALTATAQTTQRVITAALPTIFDRPTPFTQNALGISPASKTSLTARVFVKDIQAEYLRLQEVGGTRTPKKTALVIPRAIRLNAYGNIPRGGIKAAKRRKDTFVGTIGGIGGVWRRPKGKGATGLTLLARFSPAKPVTPRFGFMLRAEATILQAWAIIIPEAIKRAMQTAR